MTRSLLLGAIALCMALIVVVLPSRSIGFSQPAPPATAQPSPLDQALAKLPPPRPHPLPDTLVKLPTNTAGDYFDQVQTPVVGALIWSNFPVSVYIQPETTAEQASPFLHRRSQQWISAMQQAVQEWHPFIPLITVEDSTTADIAIWRNTPPLQIKPVREAGDRRLSIPRARSAETRYELYAQPAATPDAPSQLAHRMTIQIRPDQAMTYLQAAARHELGHAIGIWGHSPHQTDALYFSQVRNPAKISLRDLNTLKRIYQQPTRLGWHIE